MGFHGLHVQVPSKLSAFLPVLREVMLIGRWEEDACMSLILPDCTTIGRVTHKAWNCPLL